MTIAKLQQFLAVCQFQSVSRAAEFLHISQPSVSGTIRDLESEFQINLFRHEGRRLVLTAEGSFLRERAQKLIRQFDELSWQMEDLGNQKNRFRIGIPPMAGTVFFPQLYKAFQAAYPEITLSITECGSLYAEKLLEQGELDLAMATLPAAPSPEFSCQKLARTQLVLCVSPSHRLARAKAIDVTMLEGEPLVLFGTDTAPSNAVLSLFAEQQLRPNVLLYSSQLSMIKQFISDGTAAAFLMDALARQEPDLVAVPFSEPIYFDTVLLWKRDQYLYNDVEHFLRFAKKFKFQGIIEKT